MNFILFLFYFSRLLSSALPLKSMYLLLLCKSMSGVLNKQFITTEIRRKVISWRTYDQYIGEFNDLVSILSANFSDKKIFPDPWIPNRDIYIYIYFSMLEILWEKRKGKLGQHAIALLRYRYREKMGRREEKGGGRRDCTRFEKRLRYWTGEKWLDVTRKRERRAANCRGSSIVAKFAPRFHARYHVFFPLLPHSFQTFFLSLLQLEPPKGKKKGYRDRNYILLLCNKRRPRACTNDSSERRGGGIKKRKKRKRTLK